jgi:hypothetical protein
MSISRARLRRLAPARAAIAWEYKFTSMPIAMPPGYHLVDPERTT